MAIIHHVRGDDRSEIKNYPEIENKDGVLTYNVTGKVLTYYNITGKDYLSVLPHLVIKGPKDSLT